MTKHTYTLHLAVAARDDQHAIRVGQQVLALVEGYRESIDADLPVDQQVFLDGVNGPKVVDHLDVTDSDDWAEHIPADDVCFTCGGGGTNRRRGGGGHRYCAACLGDERLYPIEDIVG